MTSRGAQGLAGAVLILWSLVAVPWAQAGCETPQSDAERAACLGTELRQTEQRINEVYETLMRSMATKEDQDKLRREQGAWLKSRDVSCHLASKERSREKWIQDVLKDYSKAVCVVRMTTARVTTLTAYATRPATITLPPPVLAVGQKASKPAEKKTEKKPDPKTVAPPREPQYELFSTTTPTTGKWYMEAKLKSVKLTELGDVVIFAGIVELRGNPRSDGAVPLAARGASLGNLFRFKKDSADAQPLTVWSYAIDLDAGKMYPRKNGTWTLGPPGSPEGWDIKLGRPYAAALTSSLALSDLVQRRLVDVNFGTMPFAYPPPDGYRPLQEK